METPYEHYWRRRREEIDEPTEKFRISMEAKKDEIELEVQGKCNPCIDDGGMFEGFCAQCGVSFG